MSPPATHSWLSAHLKSFRLLVQCNTPYTFLFIRSDSSNTLGPDSRQTSPEPTNMKLVSPDHDAVHESEHDAVHKADHLHLERRPKRQLWQRHPSQVALFAVTSIIIFGIFVALIINRPERCGEWYLWGVSQTSFHLGRLVCHISLSHIPCFDDYWLWLIESSVGTLFSAAVSWLTMREC